VGGLINIITKKIQQMLLFSADVYYFLVETNDLGVKLNVGKKATFRFKLFQIQSKN
jgi:outer membrane receptor for ferrienterochelin and colicin